MALVDGSECRTSAIEEQKINEWVEIKFQSLVDLRWRFTRTEKCQGYSGGINYL